MHSPNKDTITIKIELSKEEYQQVRERAEQKHITMKEYGRLRLLDDVRGTEELRREIMTAMPDYYNHVSELTDSRLYSFFLDFGETLCRY